MHRRSVDENTNSNDRSMLRDGAFRCSRVARIVSAVCFISATVASLGATRLTVCGAVVVSRQIVRVLARITVNIEEGQSIRL